MPIALLPRRGTLILLAAALGLLASCTAVVVDQPYVYEPPPPVVYVPAQPYAAPPPAVIVVPGQTYSAPQPNRRQINNRMNVCTANYNTCMASCNNFQNPSQRALCINQCNAAMQNCQNRSLN